MLKSEDWTHHTSELTFIIFCKYTHKMEDRSPEEIFNMPYNYSELEHQSRERHGFHLFMSRYNIEFKNLEKMDQLERIKGREWRVAHDRDLPTFVIDCDEDSTDTPICDTAIKGYEIMRASGMKWRNLSMECKMSWKRRAIKLNKRKLPGKFNRVPLVFLQQTISFEQAALNSMSKEWMNISKNFQRSITNKPRAELSPMEYVFGKERVKLLSQTYRVFQMTNLILFALFGRQRSLRVHEKIHETRLVRVVHVASQDRIQAILMMNGLCAASIERSGLIYSCSGKVVIRKNNLQGVGYIKSEHGNKWTVHLSDDTIIVVNRVSLREDRTGYLYPEGRRDRNVVVQYIPIRFIIKNDGTIRYTLNRYTVKKSNGHLVPQFSA